MHFSVAVPFPRTSGILLITINTCTFIERDSLTALLLSKFHQVTFSHMSLFSLQAICWLKFKIRIFVAKRSLKVWSINLVGPSFEQSYIQSPGHVCLYLLSPFSLWPVLSWGNISVAANFLGKKFSMCPYLRKLLYRCSYCSSASRNIPPSPKYSRSLSRGKCINVSFSPFFARYLKRQCH